MIILPNGAVAAFFYAAVTFTGVGDHGIVADGRPMSPATSGGTRLYIFTGDNPDTVGTATLDVSAMVGTKRPVCIAMAAWTMPEYAFGYPLPEWPLAFFDQAAYDITAHTVTIRWRTFQPLNPHSNYAVNVICPQRQ